MARNPTNRKKPETDGTANIVADSDKLDILWKIADKFHHTDIQRFNDELTAERAKNSDAEKAAE